MDKTTLNISCKVFKKWEVFKASHTALWKADIIYLPSLRVTSSEAMLCHKFQDVPSTMSFPQTKEK